MTRKLFTFFILLSVICCQKIIIAQDLELLLKEADRFTLKFENENALLACQQADENFPDNWEVKWRLSRALVNVASEMPTSTDEQEEKQLATYNSAFKIADKAVSLAPDKSICYLRRAIANAKIALFEGIFSVSDVVDQVRDDCIKAIGLNNGGNYVQSLAHYVLAETHAQVSKKWAPARSVLGLGWADLDTALVEFKKAIELKSNYTMFYVDYGIALMREDSLETAKEMFELALQTPNTDINDHKRKEEAKELLAVVNEELE